MAEMLKAMQWKSVAAAKSGDFELADKKIADAEESLVHASFANRNVNRRSKRQ